ncbi:MAG: citrate synthase [Anaerolineales bacterium]|nr:MAG: citrate synthase [Anaerolineales bacterium]
MAEVKSGLEGVVVAQSKMSKVLGDVGRLIYSGYDIHDLADHDTCFEEVAYMLWYCCLPTQEELDGFQRDMISRRGISFQVMDLLRTTPEGAHPMAVLRTAVSGLALNDPEADDISHESNLRKAADLAAKIPTIIAAIDRNRKGLEPLGPRNDLNHAANFLYMLHGREPSETEARAINLYLVLLADHGFNASTFSARVTAATQSDMYSAVTSAIGTLKGPAHGGATEAAMEQLVAIGDVENVDAWFQNARAQGRRVMGMGHRVYKVEDPRARHLRNMAAELAEQGDPKWFQIAERLEHVALRDPYFMERSLYPNVDFYSPPVLNALGIETDLFTTIFAMARVVGWTGHLLEQYADNRLIRPRAEYIGPMDLKWVPIGERK